MNEKSILFIGLSATVIKEIQHLFETERYTPLFSQPDDFEKILSKDNPSMIATGDLSWHEESGILQKIKKAAAEKNIPVITIISGGRIKPYISAHSEELSTIITTPIMKSDFFHFLDRCIDKSEFTDIDSADEAESSGSADISEFTGSLILNILAQNRIVKTLLKKKGELFSHHHTHHESIEKFRESESELWDALEYKWFRLYYQPVMNMASDKLAGFEALIRIEHPDKGLISPGEFISVAENSAIIFPLGLWIIEEACRQIDYWKAKFCLETTHLRININLSAKQFIHPQLTSHIFEITDKYGIDHNDIGFELTESAFMDDMESANISLLELRSRKFPLYMDDFGTGYSSLSYLMHFPMDIIKIDQSFVKWMHIDEQSETIVKSIVNLAHNLGLKVVAEGVDDESHIGILKNCGCDYGQGYLFSKPLPADKADEYISNHFECRSK